MSTSAKITVAGAGFAALTGVRELRKRLPDAEITLVAPKPEFVYLPSLIWVPYGLRKGEDLVYDIMPLLKKLGVTYVQGSVRGISEDGRTLQTTARDIENDTLLIATGGAISRSCPVSRTRSRFVKVSKRRRRCATSCRRWTAVPLQWVLAVIPRNLPRCAEGRCSNCCSGWKPGSISRE